MDDLLIVSGAPGAGKSATVEAIRSSDSHYPALDIDWLAESASSLAGSSIYTDSNTWKPYGDLWFEVLHSLLRNSLTPIFFTPNSPSDIDSFGRPKWCNDIHWLLLDCSDEVRSERLEYRTDWTTERKEEAFQDAQELRKAISNILDTSSISSVDVAIKVIRWAESVKNGS